MASWTSSSPLRRSGMILVQDGPKGHMGPVAQLVERRAYRNISIQMSRESRGFNPRLVHFLLSSYGCKKWFYNRWRIKDILHKMVLFQMMY